MEVLVFGQFNSVRSMGMIGKTLIMNAPVCIPLKNASYKTYHHVQEKRNKITTESKEYKSGKVELE